MEVSYPKKKIYTLFLNSSIGFRGLLPATTQADVAWNVDWDALFNRDNYIYKECYVRVRLTGEPNTTQSVAGASGVLVCNLGANFTGKNVSNVVLGPLFIEKAILMDGGNYTNNGQFMTVNTMGDAQGQQVDMPFGLTRFNLQQWRNGYGANGNEQNFLITGPAPFSVLLQFELC